MNPLALVSFWPYMALAAVLLFSGGYLKGCTDESARGASFRAAVETVGKAQQALTSKRVKANLERKRVSDAENLKLRTDYVLLSRRLRERTGTSIVPSAPANALRPDLVTFDRAAFNRAVGEFLAETEGLLEEGDTGRIDLDSARRWAQQFKGE